VGTEIDRRSSTGDCRPETGETTMLANIGTPEILIILGVIVLIFGSTQLPKLARSVGQAQQEFKQGLKEGAREEDDADDEDEERAEAKPSKRRAKK
jgi:sec-independent protein translocase protein TatA